MWESDINVCVCVCSFFRFDLSARAPDFVLQHDFHMLGDKTSLPASVAALG